MGRESRGVGGVSAEWQSCPGIMLAAGPPDVGRWGT